jgi:alpha-D-ribose 1-methylphosphonate 5-triphosphate diphosphatase
MSRIRTMTPDHLVLSNARLVLADRVVNNGWVAIADGRIVEIGDGAPPGRSDDVDGDHLIPGLVELHTDHLEAHFMPRPGVRWAPVAAVMSYDAQLAGSGITTVLDSLRVWQEEGAAGIGGEAETLANAVDSARSCGMLRADHFLHLRCEVPMPNVVAEAAALIGRPGVRLLSLMDHTPGQRQFRDENKLRNYYRGKSGGLSNAELDVLFERRRRYSRLYRDDNYRELVSLARRHRTPLASHDDTTLDHVAQAIDDGVAIAEFPTTLEAAERLHAAGVRVLMGAPNLVRGASHSGNVATSDLAQAGILDALSSDYIPASLLLAAMGLPRIVSGIELPAAVRTVTKTPAEAVGLHDRGEIAVGKRADLVRVRTARDLPVVVSVWRQGRRVA